MDKIVDKISEKVEMWVKQNKNTVVIVISIALFFWYSNTHQKPTPPAESAAYLASYYVEHNYPKTTVDGTTLETHGNPTEGVYYVKGNVDTQNVYGASIKSYFIAKVCKDSGGHLQVVDCHVYGGINQ